MGIVILTSIILLIAIISSVIVHYTDRPFISEIIALVAWVLFVAFCGANIITLMATAEDPAYYNEYCLLETLKPSVEASSDEALRFDYYLRVKEYNKNYDHWKQEKESFWFGWITGNKYNNCERIEFELRPGDSSGLESEAPHA